MDSMILKTHHHRLAKLGGHLCKTMMDSLLLAHSMKVSQGYMPISQAT